MASPPWMAGAPLPARVNELRIQWVTPSSGVVDQALVPGSAASRGPSWAAGHTLLDCGRFDMLGVPRWQCGTAAKAPCWVLAETRLGLPVCPTGQSPRQRESSCRVLTLPSSRHLRLSHELCPARGSEHRLPGLCLHLPEPGPLLRAMFVGVSHRIAGSYASSSPGVFMGVSLTKRRDLPSVHLMVRCPRTL